MFKIYIGTSLPYYDRSNWILYALLILLWYELYFYIRDLSEGMVDPVQNHPYATYKWIIMNITVCLIYVLLIICVLFLASSIISLSIVDTLSG